jgi:Domain of unknown function (DUF4185)
VIDDDDYRKVRASISGTFQAFEWKSKPPENCPLSISQDLQSTEFLGRYANYTRADTWYPSWGADDVLYSPFTDGMVGPIASSSIGAIAHTGHARILGNNPLDLTVVPLGTNYATPLPYGGRYPCGSLVHDGIWYYGTYCLDETPGRNLSWDVLGPFVGFRISRDNGQSWEDCPHLAKASIFGESGKDGGRIKIGTPHVVDFGKNMQHSPDGKMYIVGHGATRTDANLTFISGDGAYLARVTPSPETINDPEAYEFFAGHNTNGEPIWSASLSDAGPMLSWHDRVGCTTITYNAPLKKYLMCVTDGWPIVGPMNSYILESDVITGPWHLVTFMERFGEQAYFLNIPSKFISDDGHTMWLVYSGNYTDAFPEITEHITAYGEPIGTNPPGSTYSMVLQEIKLK